MKKILWILALVPLLAFAQKEQFVKEYCFMRPWKLNNAEIITENGDSILCDSLGNKLKFKNTLHMLNYLNKKGWTLQETTILPSGAVNFFVLWREKKEGE